MAKIDGETMETVIDFILGGPKITDAFELWCWRILLRVPWTARRFNQCILKEIGPGCSLENAKAETPVLWPPHVKS